MAADFTNRFNTKLSPDDEKRFQGWLKRSGKVRDLEDYDLRGWWKSGGATAPNGHGPDTFKKPNHPTFSNESIYSGKSGYAGGSWEEVNGKWQFRATNDNLQFYSRDALSQYFSEAETDSKLIFPAQNLGPTQPDNLSTTLVAKGQQQADQDVLARARARRAQRETETTEQPKPEGEMSALDRAGAVAVDIGGGIVEIPGALLSGARDAIQETLDLGFELDKKTADLTGFWPALQITDPTSGELDVKMINLAKRRNIESTVTGKETKGLTLPEGPKQDTKTGQIVESVAQFGAGFMGAKKFTAAAGLLKNAGPITKAAIQGAIADFAAFDGQDGRLADLVAKVPGLGELVPEFMKTTENEDEIAGRLKNTLEGAGVGVAFDFALSAFRAMRAQRRAQKALSDVEKKVGAVAEAEAARAEQVTATVEEISGNPSGHRVRKAKSDGPGDYDQWQPNLARINSSDDIKATIAELIEKNVDEVDAARRGTVSHATTEAEASMINAWEALKNRNPGQTLSASESVAARQLWATSGRNVRDAAQAYLASPGTGTQFAMNRAVAVHRAIQAEVMGTRAEAGRILDSWKIPAGDSFKRMKEIEDILAGSGATTKQADDMAKRIAMLGDEQIDKLDNTILSAMQKSSDVFGEVWRFSLLSSPKTHLVNAISNFAVLGLDIAETAAAGHLGRLVGNPETAELITEAAIKGQAVRSAIGDQFKYFAENKKFNNMGVTVGKIDTKPRRAVSAASFNVSSTVGASLDAIGKVLTVPQDLLGGADDFFKGVNFKAELTSQAHRIATQEVQAGLLARDDIGRRMAELVSEPSNELWEQARLAAQTRTFTKPPAPGGVVQGVMTARRWMNASGLPIGHILLPFINTPANIMKFTFDRTPLGYFTLRQELSRGGKEAAVANAKIAMGTSGLFLGADLASNGMITGGGPSDPAQRQALERTGWQPYAVKLGDKYIRYERLEPMGNFLSMGADFQEILANRGYDDGEDKELFSVIGRMTGAIGNAMLSKTYLTGVSDFFNLLSDPDRYGPDYFDRIVSSFVVPAGLAEARRQVDPLMRETNDALTAIKNRLPGMSDSLAARRDLWGRPGTYQSHIGQAYDALSPYIARKIDPEPVDAELLRLRYFPSMPDRSISVPYQGRNVSVSLKNSPEIYSRMVELAGNDAKVFPKDTGALEFLNEFVESSAYERLADGAEPTPGTKAYAIRKVISASRKAASQMVYREYRSELTAMAERQVLREEQERARQEEAAALEAAQALAAQ